MLSRITYMSQFPIIGIVPQVEDIFWEKLDFSEAFSWPFLEKHWRNPKLLQFNDKYSKETGLLYCMVILFSYLYSIVLVINCYLYSTCNIYWSALTRMIPENLSQQKTVKCLTYHLIRICSFSHCFF